MKPGRRRASWIAGLAVGVAGTPLLGAEEAPVATVPTVAALSWMTGTWAGAAGPGELEENWTVPKAGAIQAVVRMTTNGKTSMVELIVIEEEAESLTLRLQQWDPGFKPRTPTPATMKLVELGDHTVAFESTSETQIAKLRYTRRGDSFTIAIEDPTGGTLTIPLVARR